MKKTQPLVLATALVVIGMLTSCSAGPTPGGAPETTSRTPAAAVTPSSGAPTAVAAPPSTTAAPSPSPSAAPIPATILIGAEAFDIVAADGSSLVSLPYTGDGDAAVSAVADLLGDPVGFERTERSPHYPAREASDFDGLTVVVNRLDEIEEDLPSTRFRPNFYVIVDAARTGAGVSITALDGTQVGSSFTATTAGKSPSEIYVGTPGDVDSVTIDLPESFDGIVQDVIPMSYGVIGFSDHGSDVISSIFAPEYLRSMV